MMQKGLRFCVVFIGYVTVLASLQASSIVSFSDPVPLFSVYGEGRPSLPTRKSQLSLSVLPYYQYARHARDANNTQTELGNRLGRLNMLGLLICRDEVTTDFPFSDIHANTALNEAYSAFADEVSHSSGATATLYESFFGPNYTPIDPADTTHYYWGKYDTKMSFSRVGLRGSIDYSFYNGVGIALRGGIAEYSLKNPIYTGNPMYDLTTGLPSNHAFAGSPDAFLGLIQQYLMSPGARDTIGASLGVNFNGVKNTGVEDATVEIYWRKGFGMKDAEGDLVVTATPLAALSMTLPTAEKKPVGNLWDISLGSDGFYGVTGQAEISFDFPGTLHVGVGGSGTYFNEDAIGSQFVPTSIYQVGIYPWRATVTKRPGALWKAYATVRAVRFIDSLSCFVNYTYVAHEKDTIAITGANSAQFVGSKLAADGAYNGQIGQIGFEYEVTPSLRFGFTLQSVFAGSRIWKTTTFAGSLSFIY